MRSKFLISLCIVTVVFCIDAQSQVYISPGVPYYRVRPPRPMKTQHQQALQHFDPVVELNFGYGFPNLDQYYLPIYYQAYHYNTSMLGPFMGTINYRFSRSTSIGFMVTHGDVKAPYYSYGSSFAMPVFNVKLDNWSYMLNMVNYLPASKTISPYTRLAIGVNNWQQNFTDAAGNKIFMQPVYLPELAYQVGVGANFALSKNAGFFIEAGYGKYILEGGLSFKL